MIDAELQIEGKQDDPHTRNSLPTVRIVRMPPAMARPCKTPEEAEAFRHLFAAILLKTGWSRERLADELTNDASGRLPKCTYQKRTLDYWETPPGDGKRSSQPGLDRRKHVHDWLGRKIKEFGLSGELARFLRFIQPVAGYAAASAKADKTWPSLDFFPPNLRAAHYIGERETFDMAEKLRRFRLHVVVGAGGVGKTARVAEATELLWKEGCFPGGRFWINIYNRGQSRAEDVAARSVLRAMNETPGEDVGVQAKRLLSAKNNLVIIEGAETVSEDNVARLIEIFPRASKVIWMTRRSTDVHHDSLREDATLHEVIPLLPAKARELLYTAAGRDPLRMPTTDLDVWDAIASEANHLPLLLGWAGKALQPEWCMEPADYLKDLQRDPLRKIADPINSDEKNAGRFLRRSLARVTPTQQIPDLPEIAERLFCTTAAFDSAYGAPRRWLAIAIGLHDDRDHSFRSALRSLISLKLVAVPEGNSEDQPIRPFHAHAQAVAGQMWREQPSAVRIIALNMVWKAALLSFDDRLPIAPPIDRLIILKRAAEAAHFAHWVQELRALSDMLAAADFASIEALQSLSENWERFLLGEAKQESLPRLKETAWLAICRHRETRSSLRPNEFTEKFGVACAWAMLAEVRRARRDWSGVEEAYGKSLKVYTELARQPDSHNRSEYRLGIAKGWAGLGAVFRAREDWSNAHAAFQDSMLLSQALVNENPDDQTCIFTLASCWSDLGGVRRAECDLAGAEEAFLSALTLCDKLVKMGCRSVEVRREMLRCWFNLVRLRKGQDDWIEAEKASRMAIGISEQLVSQNQSTDHLHRLAVALSFLGDVLLQRRDFAGAEEVYMRALSVAEKLSGENQDMLDFEYSLFVAWADLGVARMKGGDFSGSREAFERALGICQRVSDLLPDVPRYQNAVATTLHSLALVYKEQSFRDKAIGFHQRALQMRIALAEKLPNLPEYQENLAVSWINECDFRVEDSDLDEAEKAMQAAFRIYGNLASRYPQAIPFQRSLNEATARLKKLTVIQRRRKQAPRPK